MTWQWQRTYRRLVDLEVQAGIAWARLYAVQGFDIAVASGSRKITLIIGVKKIRLRVQVLKDTCVPNTCGSWAPGWDCLGEALGGARCWHCRSGSRKTTLIIGVKKIRLRVPVLKDTCAASGLKLGLGRVVHQKGLKVVIMIVLNTRKETHLTEVEDETESSQMQGTWRVC